MSMNNNKCDVSYELVFGCQDTAVLILQHLDVESLKSLRVVNKVLQRSVDRWVISRLVLDLDEIRCLETTEKVEILSYRFSSVRHLVIRHAQSSAEIGNVLQIWHTTSMRNGRVTVKKLELDSCIHLECWDTCTYGEGFLIHGIERLELYGCACDSIDVVSSLSGMLGPILSCIRVEDMDLYDSKFRIPAFENKSKVDIRTLLFLDTINDDQQEQSPLFSSLESLSFYQERLENLDLSGNVLSIDNIRLLFLEGEFLRLKKLRLRRCNLHEGHAEVISFSSSFPALCHLDIADNQLGTQASMYYISSSVQLTKHLYYLDVSNQLCCQEDCIYGLHLSMNFWESLITLKINQAKLNAAGMHGLLQSRMPCIRNLVLRETYLTSDALIMLGNSHLFSWQLETLDLSGGVNGVEVRRAVGAMTRIRAERLKKLSLKRSGLTSARAKSADRKALKELCKFHGSVEILIR